MTAFPAPDLELHTDDHEIAIKELPSEDREMLARLLDEYLTEIETGFEPDVDRLLAGHRHLSAPLHRYLDSLKFLHRTTSVVASPTKAAGVKPAQATEQMLGDYRLIREIGRGGMGVVYEAWQVSLDRRVALKVLPFAAVLDPKYIARFQNEVRAAAQLQHPHIVPVFGVGCDRGVHYYSMQFIDGQPLDQAIQGLRGARVPTTTPMPARREDATLSQPVIATASTQRESTIRTATTRAYLRSTVQLAVQAANALQHAHEFGIVHRDIKPSNLLVDRQGQLWITDFGLARVQASAELTVTGDIIGTLRYMSPEQAAGRHALVDQRADIYALGATLYELLTLRAAFPGDDRQLLLRQIENQEPPPPRRVNPAIPVDLETILLKAMSKHRELRYFSASDFADDLQRFLDGHPTRARRPSYLDRSTKWLARHRRMAVATAVFLLLTSLVSVTAAIAVAQKERATAAALFRAETHLATAKQVVDRFGAEMSERLARIPAATEVRGEMLEESLRFYEDLARYAHSDPTLQRDAATAAFKAAAVAEKLGHLPRAAELYEVSRQRFKSLATTETEDRDAIRVCERRLVLLAAIEQNNTGRKLAQEGRIPEAVVSLNAARQILEGLLEEEDADAELSNCLAGVLGNLAVLELTDRTQTEGVVH
ncbi:MAG: serine/threonine protein kinase [Planctomycetaceae bacterium]|nr:serine/threonine protein kinase [Planctomycetales bacterium]MCB9874096.1 serine/threonine protein kinase [Planctomycetaceae bacterium]MCB9940549.1 serine/threonine protein kinase [Planctomycetaceae bacterium]HRX78027.1 serine/threonine-protein kinase [Pirellulaceae bacterium]